ncbi:GNAT family protein, partial [Streptomyces sp. NPDC002668]|uniref:GNAT family N-acetyltransferase n=1 Tax=Streptomyces sp. NPDC002668 TaxID=3154422 RepID=UPI0033336EDE
MLRGSKVGLRARHEDDIPILRAELYDDVVNSSRAEGRPWRPITPGSKDSRLVVDDKEQGHVPFSVVELDGGTLVGTALLSNIDNHNRSAHIGLGLLPSSRGKGYGTDVVAV